MAKAGGAASQAGFTALCGPWMLTERSGVGLCDVGVLGPAARPGTGSKQLESPFGGWKGREVGMSEVRGRGGEAGGLQERLDGFCPELARGPWIEPHHPRSHAHPVGEDTGGPGGLFILRAPSPGAVGSLRRWWLCVEFDPRLQGAGVHAVISVNGCTLLPEAA